MTTAVLTTSNILALWTAEDNLTAAHAGIDNTDTLETMQAVSEDLLGVVRVEMSCHAVIHTENTANRDSFSSVCLSSFLVIHRNLHEITQSWI